MIHAAHLEHVRPGGVPLPACYWRQPRHRLTERTKTQLKEDAISVGSDFVVDCPDCILFAGIAPESLPGPLPGELLTRDEMLTVQGAIAPTVALIHHWAPGNDASEDPIPCSGNPRIAGPANADITKVTCERCLALGGVRTADAMFTETFETITRSGGEFHPINPAEMGEAAVTYAVAADYDGDASPRMTPEEQAIVDYVRGLPGDVPTAISKLRDALLASEQPPTAVWPDPPTDDYVWQRTSGRFSRDGLLHGDPTKWRKLIVTYTVWNEES